MGIEASLDVVLKRFAKEGKEPADTAGDKVSGSALLKPGSSRSLPLCCENHNFWLVFGLILSYYEGLQNAAMVASV